MSENNSNISLTKADLQELITTAVTAAVAASKKPSEFEQSKIDAEQKRIESDQANRKKVSAGVLEERENKKRMQQMCSHEHPDGNTHCVYVQEKAPSPGYMLCQKNQCVIRPGVASPNYKGTVIYSHELFNKLFQKLRAGSGDIIS
jgi:hypothetical protein